MSRQVPLAWLQLTKEKLRLAAAIAGVAFGVILIFVQLGFQAALFDSSVRFHSTLDYDIAIVSPKTSTIVMSESFARSRLYQVPGVEGVESVTPVYLGPGNWRNPKNPSESRTIFVFGFDPSRQGFAWPGIEEGTGAIQKPDHVLFDRESRVEYGPVVDMLGERAGRVLETEVNDRRIKISGLYTLGTSFGIDGSIVTSDLNFMRIFPDRKASNIDIGLVHLRPGANLEATRDRIVSSIPGDVEILTKAEFVALEVAHWNGSTPIGFVFAFGVVMGLVVGTIIVYQILFSDVQDSLSEYATLKAMGYTHNAIVGVVMREALLLAVMGFVPAVLVSLWVYDFAGNATNLPIEMTVMRGVAVLALTITMCCVSAALAIRKLKAAQPAEIF